MPLPVHAIGMPGTEVVPHDFQESHAPVARKTRTARADLSHAQKGKTIPGPYRTDVPIRIQAIIGGRFSGGGQLETAEETIHIRSYLLTVDPAEAPDIGDLVTVTSSPDDVTLLGRSLMVNGVVRGTMIWDRVMYATIAS